MIKVSVFGVIGLTLIVIGIIMQTYIISLVGVPFIIYVVIKGLKTKNPKGE